MPDHRARATNRSWLRPAISLREPRAHAARRPLGSNIRRPVQIAVPRNATIAAYKRWRMHPVSYKHLLCLTAIAWRDYLSRLVTLPGLRRHRQEARHETVYEFCPI